MKIAVFLPNWIGDAVMATPAVRALRQHYPKAKMIGILKPYIAGVLEGSPWFDELLYLDAKGPRSQRWFAVAMRLRQEQPDLAILFPNSFRSALVARLAGCRRRIGYNRYGRGLLLTHKLQPLRDPSGKIAPSPIIDAYNLLVEQIRCPPPGYRQELFTTAQDEKAADVIWAEGDFHRFPEIVCLNPGAAFGAAKYWPKESFATLAQNLVDRRRAGVLVLCGPGEQGLARQVVQLTKRPGVLSLAEQNLSLGLTKACIRRSDLLITTDSGPRHFGVAFDKPVITLFGPTHIAWTETYHVKAIHLQKKVECGPCQLRVCPIDHRCMKLLTPKEVFTAATDLLARCARAA